MPPGSPYNNTFQQTIQAQENTSITLRKNTGIKKKNQISFWVKVCDKLSLTP